MNSEILNLMKCPFCGSNFEIASVLEEKQNHIHYGRILCNCDEYPIIDGILYLKKDKIKPYVLQKLNLNRLKEASAIAHLRHAEDIYKIVDFFELKRHLGFVGKLLLRYSQNSASKIYKKYSDERLAFLDLESEFDHYFRYRFSSETLWTLYSFIPLLKRKNARILDMSCGVGYASFLISSFTNPSQLFSLDRSFSCLYLLKKYFAKNAECICLDGNYPLPFKDEIFSSVLMMDALHYIDARAMLAKEFERVTTSKGMLLLSHVHNSLVQQPHDYPGTPMNPDTWKKLFHNNYVKAFSEEELTVEFLSNDRVDLSNEHSQTDLDSSKAICLISTNDVSLFTIYENVQQHYLQIKDHLIINPAYQKEDDKNNILTKTLPDYFKKEYPLSPKYLPEKITFDEQLEETLAQLARKLPVNQEDLETVEELMKSFVIINAPENYI